MLEEAQKYPYEKIEIRLKTGDYRDIKSLNITTTSLCRQPMIALLFEELPTELLMGAHIENYVLVNQEDICFNGVSYKISCRSYPDSIRYGQPVCYFIIEE